MTKDTYEVSSPLNGGPPRRRPANSFCLCFCTILVVLLICIIVLMFSFRWCDLGLFRKDESQTAMLERIRYATETTKNAATTGRNTFKNLDIILSTTQTETTPTQAKTPLITSTSKPTITTTSKKYVNSFLSYLKYLKSLHNKTEPLENWVSTFTNNVTERVVGENLKENENKTGIETNSVNISTTHNQTVSSLQPIKMEKIIENKTIEKHENAITYKSSTKKKVEEHISTTSEGITRELNISTTEDVTSSDNPMLSSTIDVSVTSSDNPLSSSTIDVTSPTYTLLSSTKTSAESDPKLNARLLQDKDVCNSTSCDLVAARIISSMDFSKQPCENFYDFACGGVIGNRKEELDVFSPKLLNSENRPEFLDKFNTFYHSCLKHEDRFNYEQRIERAKNSLHSIGSFQFDGQKNKTYNITEFVANLILFKAMPLFEVDVDIDPVDSTYILKLMMPDQTSLDFEHWSSLAESKRKCLREMNEHAVGSPLNMTVLYRFFRNCQMNYSDFLDAIDTAVIELGFFSQLTEKELFKHIRDIRVFIEFEIFSLFEEIAAPPNLQEMVIRRQLEKIKLKQLEKEFPLIEWEKLFRMISNENISSETIIQMSNRQYFEDVFRSLSSLDRGMLNNAFLAILAYSLFENTVLPSHKHSRTDYCNERSEELMPDIVNYLYKKIIKTEELNEHNTYITELYQDLAKSFNKSLDNREWLDETSRSSIRKKLDRIQLALFRNDDIDSEVAYLLDGYKDLMLQDSDYQYNFFNLMKFRRKRLYSLQGQKVSSENMYRYFVDATKEEPIFFYANDIVCIPYGLAKRATRDLPRYIIMAQVGFPLAKIIGHAFDPVGMQYRVHLSETANVSYQNFAEQTRDMIVLSNPIKFGGEEYFFTLNNALSESERVAENTALRLLTDSFSTFQNSSLLPWVSYKFKKEKIFFLAMTQEFCRDMGFTDFMIEAYESHILPPQFRIENILGNSEEFLKQFSCRPGSAMTRFEDRLQFPYLMAMSKEEMDYMN